MKYDKNTVLNTDADEAYNILNDKLNHIGEVVDYESSSRLYWIHKVISNVKSTMIGVFHDIDKKYLSSFVHEFEWCFNHRYKGNKLHLSVFRLLGYRIVMTRKDFTHLILSNVSDGL